MRIAITSAHFRPHVGGIERFVETLAGGLAARGHKVTVLCCRSGHAPLHERLDGYEIVRVPATFVLERTIGVPYPLPSPALRATLRRVVANAEVVHVQDAIYPTSVAALRAARRQRVPTVLTQHVAFVPQHNRALNGLQHAATATFGRAARLATIVVTLNPAVSEWAARTWGIPEPRVLPVGVSPTPGPVDRAAVRRSFGLDPDRFVALFVGRDVPKKGLDVCLAASDPAYDLVAVSDRPGATPFMSADRLGELRASVDAFVLPSEGEGFPVTLQEAFAAGLPVVTTMQPGYDHYIRADDVLVVEREASSVREALVRLAGSAELRERLAARSLAVAERHFGIDRFVSAYEEVYAATSLAAKDSAIGGR